MVQQKLQRPWLELVLPEDLPGFCFSCSSHERAIKFLTYLPVSGMLCSMSENSSNDSGKSVADAPSETARAAETEAPKVVDGGFGVPIDMFVKGGTTSRRHDRMVAEEEADAERRRDEQAFMRHMASIPIEEGGARMYENRMALNPTGLPTESAKVELTYLRPSGEPEYNHGKPLKCLADIIVGMDPLKPEELTLIVVCPQCEQRMPQGQCQIQIRQSNRNWYLDPRTAGELIAWEEQDELGRKRVIPYRSAGRVMDGERFTCPRCDWSARIDNNRVWPDK